MNTYRFGPGIAIGYLATAAAAILLFFGLYSHLNWMTALAIIVFIATAAWWITIRRRVFPHEGRQRSDDH